MRHGGKLTRGPVQARALNRYAYQSILPIKDAVVVSSLRDHDIRMRWRHHVEDHDRVAGGIERWLQLTDGLGLDRAQVEPLGGILPTTCFTIEAKLHFVRDRRPLEAITSSLTELSRRPCIGNASRACWSIPASSFPR